jgi:uncharacterized protein YutE (UPF0331/DUF86 family)
LLSEAGKITPELAAKMRRMVGFRNVAVHQYRQLNLDILRWIVETGKDDFVHYCGALGIRISLYAG